MRVAQNQADYPRHFDKLSAEHTYLLQQLSLILTEITDRQNRLNTYEHYQLSIAKLDPGRIDFTPYLWHTLTDHTEVTADGTITFVLRARYVQHCIDNARLTVRLVLRAELHVRGD